MGVQHADERHISIAFREVQAVADDKQVRDFEPDIIGLDVFKAAGGFIEPW